MQKLKISILFFSFFLFKNSFTQPEAAVLEYITTYKDIAISEMKRTGIPAAIKLAQGIHETDAGTSVLVKKSNNHFGLKCKSEWTGMSVSHTDDAPNECFRKYAASEDSYRDQSNYLKKTPRYAFLFNLKPTDYTGWAYGLKKAGYATNPKYSQVLIKIIEEYSLQDYTLIALGKMKPGEETLVKSGRLENSQLIVAAEVIQPSMTVEKPVVVNTVEKSNAGPAQPETIQAVAIEPKQKAKDVSKEKEVVQEIKPAYPEGEFKINETRVVYVKQGTSFLALAEKYSLPLTRIFEFNDMKEQEFTDKDQLIYIMRKRKTGLNEQHEMKPGETLHDIAQAEALRLESLLEYNFLQPHMKPAVGSVLYLRTKAPAMPALASGK
jgi:hypothetical protein